MKCVAAEATLTAPTARTSFHKSRQSFLRMCHTICFPSFDSDRPVSRRPCQRCKNGPQAHRLCINSQHTREQRLDSLTETVFGESTIDECEDVSHRPHLQPVLRQLAWRGRHAFQREMHFPETSDQIAHGFLKQQLPLVQKRHVR